MLEHQFFCWFFLCIYFHLEDCCLTFINSVPPKLICPPKIDFLKQSLRVTDFLYCRKWISPCPKAGDHAQQFDTYSLISKWIVWKCWNPDRICQKLGRVLERNYCENDASFPDLWNNDEKIFRTNKFAYWTVFLPPFMRLQKCFKQYKIFDVCLYALCAVNTQSRWTLVVIQRLPAYIMKSYLGQHFG